MNKGWTFTEQSYRTVLLRVNNSPISCDIQKNIFNYIPNFIYCTKPDKYDGFCEKVNALFHRANCNLKYDSSFIHLTLTSPNIRNVSLDYQEMITSWSRGLCRSFKLYPVGNVCMCVCSSMLWSLPSVTTKREVPSWTTWLLVLIQYLEVWPRLTEWHCSLPPLLLLTLQLWLAAVLKQCKKLISLFTTPPSVSWLARANFSWRNPSQWEKPFQSTEIRWELGRKLLMLRTHLQFFPHQTPFILEWIHLDNPLQSLLLLPFFLSYIFPFTKLTMRKEKISTLPWFIRSRGSLSIKQ